MGGYINVGFRGKNGVVRNALSYTSDLSVFPRCPQFLAGLEDRVSELVDRQSADPDFGPYCSAPYSYGYRFADFQTNTLLDMQCSQKVLGISWAEMTSSLARDDGIFRGLLQSITSVTRPRLAVQTDGYRSGRYEPYVLEFEAQTSIEELFKKCEFFDHPEITDFYTLNINPGRWRVLEFEPNLEGATEFKEVLSQIITLSEGDELAWNKYMKETALGF